MTMIPITKPCFGPEELRAVQRPLEGGWVVQGPFVQEFEEKFQAYTGADIAVATTSCTTALHIAVAALDLQPGAEVIVPAFTWISTANVIEYMGAKPVFCDIDLRTFNIDTAQIEARLTPRTVGIIPVHLFGLCADMRPILEISKKHRLWVVEDAACAFGAWYHGQHAGTFGEFGCFSFHPRKSITTGEGGMVTTSRVEFGRLARSLRDHGASRSDLDRHRDDGTPLLPEYDRLGFNYRMTDIQGALGSAQMERAPWILEQRTHRARVYDNELRDLEWLVLPTDLEEYRHGYQSYVCLFCPEEPSLSNVNRLHKKRNELMRRLNAKGIATRQGTHAPTLTGYYARKYDLAAEQYPQAYIADRASMSLPLYPQMTELDQDRVISELRQTFDEL